MPPHQSAIKRAKVIMILKFEKRKFSIFFFFALVCFMIFGISIQKSIQIHLLLVLASMKLHHFAFFDTANLMKRHIGGLGLIFSAKTGLCLMRLILLAGALEYSKNLIHYLC